ncbi:MAG: hypothetical protein KC656_28315, partial [Myxococcales bacterium]|nr:hypothetical protein [Myxococcales bacterium]
MTLLALLFACGDPCRHAPGCLVAEELAAGVLSVRAPAADDVWIVGAPDASGPLFLHHDGATTARMDTSAWADHELWWVLPLADEVIAVGDRGTLLELDRASGTAVAIDGPTDDMTFFGVWGASADDVWAV